MVVIYSIIFALSLLMLPLYCNVKGLSYLARPKKSENK
jgi:hypothetical protein